MRTRRPRARRRLRHAVRLVKLGAARPAIDSETCDAWRVAIAAPLALYEAFPAFYAEQALDGAVLTPELAIGCAAALWQLTEQAGAALRWPGEYSGDYDGITRYDLAGDPADTLRTFTEVEPGYLAELGGYVWSPQPAYYGWGVQSMLENERYADNLLTAALWHLFHDTSLGLGIDIDTLLHQIDEDDRIEILRMRRLPRDVPMNLFAQHLDLPAARQHGVAALDLIGYAFGQTNNELANHDEYEVLEYLMGEFEEDYTWRDIPDLVRRSQQARAIFNAFIDWRDHVDTVPKVRRLAAQLHKAARAAAADLERPKTLAAILFDPDADAEAPGLISAYAEALAD